MRQVDYRFHSIAQAIDGVADIKGYIESQPHTDALLSVYAAGIEEGEMARLLDKLNEELPDVARAGISEFFYDPDSDDPYRNLGVCVNVMLSDTARFHVLQIPCEPGDETSAAERFAEEIAQVADVKGVALYPSNLKMSVAKFLEKATADLQGVPFFGAMAVDSDASFGRPSSGDMYGIGAQLLKSGFTAAVFCGAELQVFMDYALGWRPVGKEMEPLLAEPRVPGESCISSIDGTPAFDVYDKYLGVEWDENFVINVCEFPLMIQRAGVDMCMIPTEVGSDGQIYLQAHINAGEKVRFSYGTRESVLGAARASSKRMRAFGAETVLMWLCGNRALFLGDEARVEWDLFREANPQLAYCHGNYEIAWYRDPEKEGLGYGGVLNSALVAVGFREGEEPSCVCGACEAFSDTRDSHVPAAPQDEGPIPLSYRVSRFFDVMTGELVHLQHNLEREVEVKTRENENLMLHVVITLAAAIDAKDAYTNGHSSRVAAYSREIARRAGYTEQQQESIYVMGVLHDVGKIGVPDSVITKPGRLTDEEFAAIKTHPATGARILAAIEEMPGLSVGAHWHHERYDGRGYPDGLAGEDIPEEARIIAVADAYDAMTSNRSYRDAMPQQRVRDQIEQGRGTQFDPRFADIMLEMIDEDVEYRMRETS